MWKTWRWKASRRTASHPLGTYSWVPKTTPLTRASVCQLETVSAPGCLKSACVEKVRDWPISPPLSPKSLTLFPLMTSKPAPPPPSMSTPQKCPFSQQPCPLPGIWHSQCLSMLDFTQYMVQWLTVLIVSVEAIEVFYGGHCVWLLWYGNHHRAWHMRTVYHWQIL